MTKTVGDMLTIMRNVTGRNDSSDPQFTDAIMIGYLSDFYQLIMGQEARFFDMNNWYEFVLPAGQDVWPIDLNAADPPAVPPVGRTVLRQPAYVDGFIITFFLDPGDFFYVWPETQIYQPSRPTAVLFYNHELTFRSPPDKDYAVKIASINLNAPLTEVGDTIQEDYWWRYIAYGASLDLLQDYNEMERVREVQGPFQRYKDIVYSRSMTQWAVQRSTPSF